MYYCCTIYNGKLNFLCWKKQYIRCGLVTKQKEYINMRNGQDLLSCGSVSGFIRCPIFT